MGTSSGVYELNDLIARTRTSTHVLLSR